MSNALENTVLLNLTLSSPGNTRKVDTGQVEVDADRDMLKLSKQLWASPEWDAVTSLLGEVRRWVQTKCLPATFIKGGFYILPLGLMEPVTERLEEFRSQLEPLVESFCRMYETRKREAVDRLRELYDEDQYPPVSKIREAFGMTWKFLSVNVPSQLASISVRHFEEAKGTGRARLARGDRRDSHAAAGVHAGIGRPHDRPTHADTRRQTQAVLREYGVQVQGVYG
jgi:hypothetical protein